MINCEITDYLIYYLKENKLYYNNFKLENLDNVYPNIFNGEYPFIVNKTKELINKRTDESKKMADIITKKQYKPFEEQIRFCQYFPFKDAENVKLEISLIEMFLTGYKYSELDRRKAIDFKSVVPLLINDYSNSFLNTLGAYLGGNHINADEFEMNPLISHKLYGEDKFIGNFSNEKIVNDFANINNLDNKEEIMARYAEYYAFNYINNMINQNQIEKAIWASRIADGFGYDILFQDKDGKEVRVEVKSTSSPNVDGNDFILSHNEYKSFEWSMGSYIVYKMLFDRDNNYKLKDIYTYKNIDVSKNDKNNKQILERTNILTGKKELHHYIVESFGGNSLGEREKKKVLLLNY